MDQRPFDKEPAVRGLFFVRWDISAGQEFAPPKRLCRGPMAPPLIVRSLTS
jgi:hypothetical protein